MPRRVRTCPQGIPQHIIQRGNNRQACFANERDFATYAEWLLEASLTCEVAVHSWVFMTNHVHLLVTPQSPVGVSRMMQTLGRRYVRYFNKAYGRTGTLWEGRFRSCPVDADHYLLTCQRYIELNPVRAGMVDSPADYHWSGYQANALGVAARLCTPHQAYLQLGNTTQERLAAYRGLFAGHMEPRLLEEIRTAVNKGLTLGDHRFRDRLERLTGRRQEPGRPGPKPRQDAGNQAPHADDKELLL